MATKKNTETHKEVNWPYGKNNYILFAIALLVIIVGFYTLSTGSMTLAPVLLVIGYMVLIPVALMIKDPSVEEKSADSDSVETAE